MVGTVLEKQIIVLCNSICKFSSKLKNKLSTAKLKLTLKVHLK